MQKKKKYSLAQNRALKIQGPVVLQSGPVKSHSYLLKCIAEELDAIYKTGKGRVKKHTEIHTRLTIRPLKLNGSSLLLLVTTQLKVLASLQGELMLVLASGAFETQHNLLRRLGLLVKNGFGLTTVSRLLSVVTTLTLSV